MVKRGALRIDDNNDFDYDLKQFDKPSKFGIEGGRISKLSLKLNGKYVAVYDRGWVIQPKTEAAREIEFDFYDLWGESIFDYV